QGTLYASHMNQAQLAWDAGGVERVRELLEQHRPKPGESDLGGFEWRYLYRLSHAEPLTTLKGGHDTGSIFGVAYSPGGKRLASAGVGEVKVWDPQTGKELLTIKDGYGSVAFSPNGKRLVGGGKVWDAETGKELLTLKGHTGRVIVFSPDGKLLAGEGIE